MSFVGPFKHILHLKPAR
jgi:hypothetical protein